MILNLDSDAFASGQVQSKLWLCEEFEKRAPAKARIWIYGGWYGMLSLLLLSRGRVDVEYVRSFDRDDEATKAANLVNNLWEWQNWKFKAWTADCEKLNPLEFAQWVPQAPNCIINTSTEHFTGRHWFDAIPAGTLCVFQGTDWPASDHVAPVSSVAELCTRYPLRTYYFRGQNEICYSPTSTLRRYMTIGLR